MDHWEIAFRRWLGERRGGPFADRDAAEAAFRAGWEACQEAGEDRFFAQLEASASAIGE